MSLDAVPPTGAWLGRESRWPGRGSARSRAAPGAGCETAVEVGSEAELDRRGRLVARLSEPPVDVLVVLTRRRVFAVENRCPHLGSVLDSGDVRGRVITCAAHGRRFDLRSGHWLAGPGRSAQPLVIMRAWVDGGKVWVAAPRTRPADAA